MSEQQDFLLTETRAQEFDERNGILHKLFNGHGIGRGTRSEGFACPALIPVDTDEVLFQFFHRVMGKPHIRFARTSVQEEQQRSRNILPAYEEPLRIAVDLDRL